MYDPELEKLIELALLDGVLTEKEKQVLFKKAEALGIDLDEFEMVLEAKLFEKKDEITRKSSNSTAAPKSNKLGDVKKCPACGAIVESFVSKCTDCGTEFRNIEASQNISKFFDKLDELEQTRKEKPAQEKSSGISFGTIIKWWLFWWILLPLKLVSFILDKSKSAYWSTTDSRKEEMIMNFPVPNSREELIEFISLASSKITTIGAFKILKEEGKYEAKWNKIWARKLEQIHSKAKVSMSSNLSSLTEINALVILAVTKEKATSKNVKKTFIVISVIILSIAFMIYRNVRLNAQAEEAQSALFGQAEKLIQEDKIDDAFVLINKMNSQEDAVLLKSKIQLNDLIDKLDEIEPLILEKKYSQIQLSLDKLTWEKISTDYSTTSIERDVVKTFIKRKEAINNQLPEEFMVEIESEYSII